IVQPSRRAAELGCAHLLPHGFDAWFLRCVERDAQKRESSIKRAVDELVALLAQPAGTGAQRGSLPAGAVRPTGTQIDQPLPFAQSAPSISSVPSMPATSAAAPMPHVVSQVQTPQPQQQQSQPQQQVWGPTHAPIVTTHTGMANAPPQRRSMLGLFAALGGLLLFGGGIGAYLVWGGDDGKRSSDKKHRSSDDDDDDGPRKKKKSSSDEPDKSDKDADCQAMAELVTEMDSESDAMNERVFPNEQAKADAYIGMVEAGVKKIKDHEWKTKEGRGFAARLSSILDDMAKALRKAFRAANAGDTVTSTAELEKVQKLTEDAEKLEADFRETCGMAAGL
ncbi:MAG: hypothetical protein HOV80_35475, partial [Polyangiaceae bacterium]|nr:hypothetical protein [Polyangiaceae bacterium]